MCHRDCVMVTTLTLYKNYTRTIKILKRGKIWEIWGIHFQERILKILYKNRIHFLKLLENFLKTVNFEEIYWKFLRYFKFARNFWNIIMTFRCNFESVLIRVGISIKMFTKIFFSINYKNILKKCGETSDIFRRNKFQDKENLKKIPCKLWRNFKMTS